MAAATKYWGDERHADAIYAIYLKKVRYVPPQQFQGLPHYRPIDPENHHILADVGSADHLQWETIRERVIRAGTLEKLVESLINDDGRMVSQQFNAFFATYRGFADAEAVLNKFIHWYESTLADVEHSSPSSANNGHSSNYNNDNVGAEASSSSATSSTCPSTLLNVKALRTRLNTIRSILICWLDTYVEDFYVRSADEEGGKFMLLNKLIDFARRRHISDLKQKARHVRERFKRIADTGGLAAQIPSIRRYSYANTVGYDPTDYGYAQHRAQMFDISRDNCVQIAEQLTYWDATLFRELRPYQCQGAIWGKRHKRPPDFVYSVRATIDQFNAVSQRVMTSIVFPECGGEFRAKIIEKWINVARELRVLKNFSSLKAVLSSLQSEPVYRLKSTWALVSKVSLQHFKELAAIFDVSEEDGDEKARTILETEGTAKSSANNLLGSSTPVKRSIPNCRRTKSDVNLAESQGTVPFLGSFLTDLTKIDEALDDKTPDGLVDFVLRFLEGLINFEKRRKEFEVLVKIRLFQSAARAYTFPFDQAFCIWFYYLPSLNENECFNRSLEVEPVSTSTPDVRRRGNKGGSAMNGFYSSPAMSMSKFQSLTKMIASISQTTVGASTAADNGPASHNYVNTSGSSPSSSSMAARHQGHNHRQNQVYHDQQGSLGQQPQQSSNDSVIHTSEEYTGSGGLSSRHIYASDSPPAAIALRNNRLLNGLVGGSAAASSREFRAATAPSTPAGTLAARTGGGKSGSANYSVSEFNPYLHFNSKNNRSPSAQHKTFDDDAHMPAGTSMSSINLEFINDSSAINSFKKTSAIQSRSRSSTPVRNSVNQNNKNNNSDMLAAEIFTHHHHHNHPSHRREDASPTASSSSMTTMTMIDLKRMAANGSQEPNHQKSNTSSTSSRSSFGVVSSGSASNTPTTAASELPLPQASKDFHLARVGLDDSILSDEPIANASNINYKCIKVVNGDRMPTLIARALEKHMLDVGAHAAHFCLVQLLPDGSEFRLPDHCNPYYAVAPDPTSPMLNFLLKKRTGGGAGAMAPPTATMGGIPASDVGAAADAYASPSAKKLNKQKRSNLLRWSSGYL